MKRRTFLAGAGLMAVPMLAGCTTASQGTAAATAGIPQRKLDRLSLASSTFRGHFDGWQHSIATMTPRLDMRTLPAFLYQTYGIRNLELWGRQFGAEGHTVEHYRSIRAAADAAGVMIVNLQVEDLPSLDQGDAATRAQVLAACKEWMGKAAILGATSIRINVTRQEGPINLDAVIGVLRDAADYGRSMGVKVLLENHGGYTQSIPNMVSLVQAVDHDFCKITIDWGAWAPPGDRYEAMQSAMPLTHIVSAKGTFFDEATHEHTAFDIGRLVRNAEAGGFRGLYSIELWANPAPANVDAAFRSHIKAITDNIA